MLSLVALLPTRPRHCVMQLVGYIQCFFLPTVQLLSARFGLPLLAPSLLVSFIPTLFAVGSLAPRPLAQRIWFCLLAMFSILVSPSTLDASG